MGVDPYLTCLIAAGSEVAGYISVYFSLRYTTRRFTLGFSLIICGLLLLIIKYVPEGLCTGFHMSTYYVLLK